MKHDISFAERIKDEIVTNVDVSDDRKLAILASFLKINGCLKIHDGKEFIVVNTENSKIAKFIYQLVSTYFHFEPHFSFERSSLLAKKTRYSVIIDEKIEEILERLKLDFISSSIDSSFLSSDQVRFGYIAGVFLSSGSCNSPASSNYHLELAFLDGTFALQMQKLINELKVASFNMRLIKRRNQFVLYLKKSDLISSFIIMIGAVACCMEFEDIRVERDFTNNDNRLFNLDNANMKKTIDSSTEQIENIKYLKENIGLDHIENEKLKVLCEIRLNNKEASLQELARELGERLEKNISKSNVYHLFIKIEQMVAHYKGEEK
ncbi:MAG: DNA-binding protein WhiA [Bacilli bacterium]